MQPTPFVATFFFLLFINALFYCYHKSWVAGDAEIQAKREESVEDPEATQATENPAAPNYDQDQE